MMSYANCARRVNRRVCADYRQSTKFWRKQISRKEPFASVYVHDMRTTRGKHVNWAWREQQDGKTASGMLLYRAVFFQNNNHTQSIIIHYLFLHGGRHRAEKESKSEPHYCCLAPPTTRKTFLFIHLARTARAIVSWIEHSKLTNWICLKLHGPAYPKTSAARRRAAHVRKVFKCTERREKIKWKMWKAFRDLLASHPSEISNKLHHLNEWWGSSSRSFTMNLLASLTLRAAHQHDRSVYVSLFVAFWGSEASNGKRSDKIHGHLAHPPTASF